MLRPEVIITCALCPYLMLLGLHTKQSPEAEENITAFLITNAHKVAATIHVMSISGGTNTDCNSCPLSLTSANARKVTGHTSSAMSWTAPVGKGNIYEKKDKVKWKSIYFPLSSCS